LPVILRERHAAVCWLKRKYFPKMSIETTATEESPVLSRQKNQFRHGAIKKQTVPLET
jgi:hypothetical protein